MKKKGFTYIEIAIAVSVFGLFMLFLAQMNHTSNSVLNLRRDRLRMNYIAQEELEKYKSNIYESTITNEETEVYTDTSSYDEYNIDIYANRLSAADSDLCKVRVEVSMAEDKSEKATLNTYIYIPVVSSVNNGGGSIGSTLSIIKAKILDEYMSVHTSFKQGEYNNGNKSFYYTNGDNYDDNYSVLKPKLFVDKHNKPIYEKDVEDTPSLYGTIYRRSLRNEKGAEEFVRVWNSQNYNIIVGQLRTVDNSKLYLDSDFLNSYDKDSKGFYLDSQFIKYTPFIKNNNPVYVVLFIETDVDLQKLSKLDLVGGSTNKNIRLIIYTSGRIDSSQAKYVKAKVDGKVNVITDIDLSKMDDNFKSELKSIEDRYTQ